MRGARSRKARSMRVVQRSGGSKTCESEERMSWGPIVRPFLYDARGLPDMLAGFVSVRDASRSLTALASGRSIRGSRAVRHAHHNSHGTDRDQIRRLPAGSLDPQPGRATIWRAGQMV